MLCFVENDKNDSPEFPHTKVRVSPDHAPSDPANVPSSIIDTDEDTPPSGTAERSRDTEVLKRCQELEEAIQQACEEEDYDRAGKGWYRVTSNGRAGKG